VEAVITIQSKELDIRGIGGIKASAIATPTIISGIAVVMLIHQLFQAKTATITSVGHSTVLDYISGVISIDPLISPGGTFEHTFKEARNYDYFCRLHPWMIGQLIVEPK
jgi:hypothetical protein